MSSQTQAQMQSYECLICGDLGHVEKVCPSDQHGPYFCSCPAKAEKHEPHSYEESMASTPQ